MAPPDVKTTQIYRGAVAFILLQLAGLAIVGFNPSLVNYLPNRTYLTSETAPPPQNPRLQECLEDYLDGYYAENETGIRSEIDRIRAVDLSALPQDRREELVESFATAQATFDNMAAIRAAEAEVDGFKDGYRPLHRQVRAIETRLRAIDTRIDDATQRMNLERRIGATPEQLAELEADIDSIVAERDALAATIPAQWEAERDRFLALADAEGDARNRYRRAVDDAYEPVRELQVQLGQAEGLAGIAPRLEALRAVVDSASPDDATEAFKEAERLFSDFDDVSDVRSGFANVRREFRNGEPDRAAAADALDQALAGYREEVSWRQAASASLAAPLARYEEVLRQSIGIRAQSRLTVPQAEAIASCRSRHEDISLYF